MISICGLFEWQVSKPGRPLPGMTGDPKKTVREYIINSQLKTSPEEIKKRAKEARRIAKRQFETDVRRRVDPEIYGEFEVLRRRRGTTY